MRLNLNTVDIGNFGEVIRTRRIPRQDESDLREKSFQSLRMPICLPRTGGLLYAQTSTKKLRFLAISSHGQ